MTRADVRVISIPGADIEATLKDRRRLVAECKGEPTLLGTRAGGDLKDFYTGLGQLLMTSGQLAPSPDVMLLGAPKTSRFEGFVNIASSNKLLQSLGIRFALVDEDGNVTLI